jgi:hypothetical protein
MISQKTNKEISDPRLLHNHPLNRGTFGLFPLNCVTHISKLIEDTLKIPLVPLFRGCLSEAKTGVTCTPQNDGVFFFNFIAKGDLFNFIF